jgi:hypothetical protein
MLSHRSQAVVAPIVTGYSQDGHGVSVSNRYAVTPVHDARPVPLAVIRSTIARSPAVRRFEPAISRRSP